MQLLVSLSFLGAAAASSIQMTGEKTAYMALRSVIERQNVCVPVPAPATCEKSCGPGNIQCVYTLKCYNPSAGEVCCSDGNYCPQGYYCTDNGCCPNGASLERCEASVTLSIVSPEPTATESATTITSDTPLTSTTTSTSSETSESTSSSSSSTLTSISSATTTSSETESPATTSSQPSVTVAPTNGTTTSAPTTVVTAGVGKSEIGGILPAVGGLVAFWMAL